MALRKGNRDQISLFPQSIEDYVSGEDPVRAYDAFVEALDLADLCLEIQANKVGCPSYDPKAMLKLLVYGYSYGIRSSRQLERATHHNVSFIWLLGGLKPDHKTIARFRQRHLKILKGVLRDCARMCLQLELIEGNVLFVDGTKVRGNCSLSRHRTQAGGKRLLAKLDQRIEALLADCQAVDQAETELGSYVAMQSELQDQQQLRDRVAACLEEMKGRGVTQLNRTDADAIQYRGHQGSHAGYNVQSSVDEQHGLVVNVDVVAQATDRNQLAKQVEQAEQVLESPVDTVCADAGYTHVADQKPLLDRGTRVIVPSQRQVHETEIRPFDERRFRYDAQRDVYWCPAGHELKYSTYDKQRKSRLYRIHSKRVCLACPHYGVCTKNKKGRAIRCSDYQEEKELLESTYAQADSQAIYRQRKAKVELPFGYVKYNLAVTGFLLRGLTAVKAEAALMFTSFNIKRMLTLLGGVSRFIKKMNTLAVA